MSTFSSLPEMPSFHTGSPPPSFPGSFSGSLPESFAATPAALPPAPAVCFEEDKAPLVNDHTVFLGGLPPGTAYQEVLSKKTSRPCHTGNLTHTQRRELKSKGLTVELLHEERRRRIDVLEHAAKPIANRIWHEAETGATLVEGLPTVYGPLPPGAREGGKVNASYSRRLRAMLHRYRPADLPYVARILRAWRTREPELLVRLSRTFGPEPPDTFLRPPPPGWEEVTTAGGDVFYYSRDGQRQWVVPDLL